MIITIDGKIHHLKELDLIERELHGLYNPDQFYKDLTEFLKDGQQINLTSKSHLTFEEMKSVDKFVAEYFETRLPEANILFIRAYLIGRLLGDSDIAGTVFIAPELPKLPSFIQEAVKRYNLSINEAQALRKATETGASLVSNTITNTQQTIKSALFEAIQRNEGIGGVEKRIKELLLSEGGELNRDWTRVAISETNNAFANGYLSMMQEGEYVIGFSMPDACPHCIELINNRVYRVLKTPPPDYSNLRGEEYARVADIWENYVWEGKNNYGRSTSPRKRIDKSQGNKEENLTYREHHELSMPVIPLHPHCRCRWINFNPRLQWIDKDGNMRLKVENPEAYKQWYEDNIQGYGE